MITRRTFIKNSTLAIIAVASGLYPRSTSAAEKLSGLCYGPFRDGQSPDLGIFPSVDQIAQDISILSEITSSLKTYGTNNSLREIPRLCAQKNMDCHVGGWIDSSDANNEKTINDLIDISKEGNATSLIVGNEVLLWGYQPEERLIEYVNRVKDQTTLPVTSSEVWDLALAHPDLMEELDYISVHVHPYWEGLKIDDAAQYVLDRWQDVKDRYPHKMVILGETGWPTKGDVHIDAVPSEENQTMFLEDLMALAKSDYLFFEAFDEGWKRSNEGEVGAHWGILYADGSPKPSAEQFNISHYRTNPQPQEEQAQGGCFISTL